MTTDAQSSVTRLKQPKAAPVVLTKTRVAEAMPRAKRYAIADATAPGLSVQIEPSGAKVFYWRGSVGKGRTSRTQLMLRIGDARSVSLTEARDTALRWAAMARAGQDPRGDQDTPSVAMGLDRYEAHLTRIGNVRRVDVLSSLRRELKAHLKRPLADLDRAAVASAVERLEADGRPGAAGWLRKSASAFLGWAEGQGLIDRNPLTGWRRPTATRAQRLEATDGQWTPVGADALRQVWHAFDAASDPRFTVYLRLLLLVGLRRGEMASLRWSDVDLDGGTITIRPASTKMGVGRTHPLGPHSRRLLADLPNLDSPDGLVFPGRTGSTMSGWTQRLDPVRAAAGGEMDPHGLRRAYRSGLSEIGVVFDIAEMMIGHKRPGLHGLYDHSTLDRQRREAQNRWEDHLAAIVGARQTPSLHPGEQTEQAEQAPKSAVSD